jgi:hypothetical protein
MSNTTTTTTRRRGRPRGTTTTNAAATPKTVMGQLKRENEMLKKMLMTYLSAKGTT